MVYAFPSKRLKDAVLEGCTLTFGGPKRPFAQRFQVDAHDVPALDRQPGRGRQPDGIPPVRVVHVEQPLQIGRVRRR